MLPDPNPQERRWWGAAVSALTLMLALVRLGQSSLWADESYTANIGLQVLKFGLPRMEGSLFVPESIEWGVRGGIWIWDGWLQYYISAAGEAIFGQTAFGARFFHTLAGALVPWAAYPLFRAIASRRGVAESATLLTGLSVQFLVAIRQARYYPEGILLTVLLLRAYQGGLVGRPRAAWMLALWSVFLFYTNFVWFSLLGVTLLIHLALVRPPLGVSARMAAAGLSALVTILPFALWSRVWDRRWGTSISSQDPYIALSAIRYYLLEINLHGAPMLLLFGAAAYAAGRAHPVRAVLCLLGAVLFPAVLPQSYTPLATWVFAVLLVVFGGVGVAMIAS
ncbi:MAG: hypothetical protein Q8R92_02175, partial [Deltaproteobacteria bacterium]|nr:hypothetical protein [Deltaproteobacteria bacterium]